jgi:HK97 family phage major capsid protein
MPKEKASELRQERARLVERATEIMERVEKDKRAMTTDEETEYNAIVGDGNGAQGKAMELALRASRIERMEAVERIGNESLDTDGNLTRKSDPLPHEDPSNIGRTGKPHRRYSMMRAIQRRWQNLPLDGLEGECHEELVKRTGKNPIGFLMPQSTRGSASDIERRAAGTFDTGSGSATIPTILEKDWIELLRNKMVVRQAGMKEISGVQGRLAIPRQTQSTTAYWVPEGGSPSPSNPVLDQVIFSPKTLGAYTDITRRFLELSILDTPEEFVREDLTTVLALGVDLAAINGTGGSNQPLGLLQNPAITTGRVLSSGTNGGTATWANIVGLFTKVAQANATTLGPFAYVSNAGVRGLLATTPKIGSTFPTFLLDDNGKLNGFDFYFSEQVPSNLTKGTGTALSAMIGGIWNQLIMAMWSGVDILVDPYTGSTSGTVRIVALEDLDIQVRHNEAFAFILDLITS